MFPYQGLFVWYQKGVKTYFLNFPYFRHSFDLNLFYLKRRKDNNIRA